MKTGNTALEHDELQTRFREIVRDRARHAPYYRLLGMEITGLASGEAYLKVDTATCHLGEHGYLHPGVIFSLADAASGVAVATLLPSGSRKVVTMEMKVNYLVGVKKGILTGIGRVSDMDGNIAVSEAEVRGEDGELVARSLATFMIIR